MPKHIESVVEEREEELIKEQEIFQEQMEVEQMDFKENISNLERTINNFSRYQSIKQHASVAMTVKSVNESLASYIPESKKFNSREGLFEMEVQDYSQIFAMQKDFRPYSNLWNSIHEWFQFK